VKEQAFYMKRAIDNSNLREALKHASNMICELRTSLLSPKNYYELYMQVFQEMQHLVAFFSDKARHGRKMLELYESVQHAGNILPRLYLLVTAGAAFIKSKDAPAKEILKDVLELCKGVQHPMRGLFLRYYLSQMMKDALPDTGTEYEAEGGGNIHDTFEFIFNNFSEINMLWVRLQSQGAVRDKQRREKERHDLRVLVGANLLRMSQLEGMTLDFYNDIALPKILEHVISVKDVMSQQYIFESMIQVFPDQFHIKTLELLLATFSKAEKNVDMKPIMVTLMKRLAEFLANEDSKAFEGVDIFSLFRTHLQAILERSTEADAGGAVPSPAEVAVPLEVQSAFLQFTLTLYPGKVHYVDMILGSTVQLLQKFQVVAKLDGNAAERVKEILTSPLSSLSLEVLRMEQYPPLLNALNYQTRKEVSYSFATTIVEENMVLSTPEELSSLFEFIVPLIKDEDDTVPHTDKEAFLAEQQQVCKLVHQVRCEDTDVAFAMLSEMRKSFGQGGPSRMTHTLQSVVTAALGLIPKILDRERRIAEGDDTVGQNAITVKKVFQFVHKTISALVSISGEAALRLWLMAAVTTDSVQTQTGSTGAYEPICYEFLTQALITFEEEVPDSKVQYSSIFVMVGTLQNIACLEEESYDNVCAKICQHGNRILKKPQQCRAIACCAHLFWSKGRQDGKRVLECLQKCLKTADAACQSETKSCDLFVEMLDKYTYFCEAGVEQVNVKFIQSLVNLCQEHVNFAVNDANQEANAVGRVAQEHIQSSVAYLKTLKDSQDPAVAALFGELEL